MVRCPKTRAEGAGWLAAALLGTMLGAGCDSTTSQGALGEPCYPNQTCNAGLECDTAAERCEIAPDSGTVLPDAGTSSSEGVIVPDVTAPLDAAPPDAPPSADAPPPPDAAPPLDGPLPDAPTGIPPEATHTASPGFFDAVLDPARHRLFISYGGGTVDAVSLHSGNTTAVTTGYKAEHLFFDDQRDEVVVSLPVQQHSAYWWDEDQEGYVAAIDATTLQSPTPIWIPLDPWQIVADGTGYAYAAGASGQWTSMVAVNLDTGWTDLTYGPRNGTNIQIHPDKDRIYGADNGISPSDIERYDLLGSGKVAAAYDSPYHGDYPMCGDLRIAPGGDTIFTRCGHIFLASNTQSKDMTWVADMGLSWVDMGFHPTDSLAYVLIDSAPVLYVYDEATLTQVSSHNIGSPASRVLVTAGYLVLLRETQGPSPKTEIVIKHLSKL